MRRKLIVVSNRGPVSFSRNERGELTAKRGGGGLVTALRGLVALHEVTWIASAISDEDHALAGEMLEETARDGSPFTRRSGLRLVLQRRLESDVVVHPAPPLGARVHAGDRSRLPHRLGRRVRLGQRRLCLRRPGGARARAGRCGVLPRLPPLPRAAHGPGAVCGRDVDALRAHPVAAARCMAGVAGAHARGAARRAAGERRDRVSHRPLAQELPSFGAGDSG